MNYAPDECRPELAGRKDVAAAMALPPISNGSMPDRYLRSRGLGFKEYPPDLRQSPRGNMLALSRDRNGLVCSYDVTYLSEDQSGGVKKLYRSMMKNPEGYKVPQDAAFRLGRVENSMGVAEGKESALAAFKRNGVVTWALGSASRMARWEPPMAVDRLHIFQDHGIAGERAAKALGEYAHASGIAVFRHYQGLGPRFSDQNDLLKHEIRSNMQIGMRQ